MGLNSLRNQANYLDLKASDDPHSIKKLGTSTVCLGKAGEEEMHGKVGHRTPTRQQGMTMSGYTISGSVELEQ